jgi:hypothetical protein
MNTQVAAHKTHQLVHKQYLCQMSVVIFFSCCNTGTGEHLQTGLVVRASSILKPTNCDMQGSHFIRYKFHMKLIDFNIFH